MLFFKDTSIILKIKQVSGGPDFTLPPFSETATILQVKEEVEKVVQSSISQLRLIYKGKVLKDSDTLASHQVKSGDTFIVQVTKAAASPTPVPSAGAAPIPQAVAPIPQADSGPSVINVAMATLVTSNNSETARIALETLLKVIDNILKNPEESKVRWLLK